MAYKIKIEPEAYQDIQDGIHWYNEQQEGLGQRFHKEVKAVFNRLKKTPKFQIRYEDIRCVPVNKCPHMVHFRINEKEQLVIVHGVFHTSLDPENWKRRK